MRITKSDLPLVLGVVLVVALWVETTGEIRAKAEAAIVAAEARADSLLTALQAADTALVRQEATYATELRTARAEMDRWRRVATAARPAIDTAFLTLPDTSPIPAYVDALERQNVACEAALGFCDSLTATLTARIAVRDTALAGVRTELDHALGRWRAAERRAGRRNAVGFGCSGPFAFAPPTAGWGVACGLTLSWRIF